MRADPRQASRVPSRSAGYRRDARGRRPSPVPMQSPPAAALLRAQRPAEPWPRRAAVERRLDTPIAEIRPQVLVANTRSSHLFPLAHQLSYGNRILIAPLLKSGDYTRAIGCRTVLAQLELSLQPGDGDFEADDPLQHALEIGFGEVLDPPRHRVGSFMTVRKSAQQPAQPFAIFDQADCPVGVDVDVVPGRHTRAALIPARRDIGVRTAEHCQHLASLAKIFDLRIGTREVAEQMQLLVAPLGQ